VWGSQSNGVITQLAAEWKQWIAFHTMAVSSWTRAGANFMKMIGRQQFALKLPTCQRKVFPNAVA